MKTAKDLKVGDLVLNPNSMLRVGRIKSFSTTDKGIIKGIVENIQVKKGNEPLDNESRFAYNRNTPLENIIYK